MGLPPSVKSFFPSLQIIEDRTAMVAIADIKRQLPSLKINDANRELVDVSTIAISLEDLRKLLRMALVHVEVDEKWYLTQVPGLGEAIKNGSFKSAADHYHIHGYLEGRPPKKPLVDEQYYLRTYPDIAQAVKQGKIKSAYDHYVMAGYAEGRIPVPSTE